MSMSKYLGFFMAPPFYLEQHIPPPPSPPQTDSAMKYEFVESKYFIT